MTRHSTKAPRWQRWAVLLLFIVMLWSLIYAITDYAQGAEPITQPTKLMVIWEENEGADNAYAHMSNLRSLADRYGEVTDYHGVTHPTLGNKFVAATGQGKDTCGVYDPLPKLSPRLDEEEEERQPTPAQCPQAGHRSVFGRAFYSGRTVRTYVDGSTRNCEIGSRKFTARQYMPYGTGSTEAPLCRKYSVPFTGNFAADVDSGNVPDLSWVIPTVDNDAHDGTLEQADAWLAATVDYVMAGADYQSGDLAIVVAFDESNMEEPVGAPVPFVVIHPSLDHVIVDQSFGHYALCNSQSTMIGAPAVAKCANRPSVLRAFGLPS